MAGAEQTLDQEDLPAADQLAVGDVVWIGADFAGYGIVFDPQAGRCGCGGPLVQVQCPTVNGYACHKVVIRVRAQPQFMQQGFDRLGPGGEA